ncbi:MAG: RodZ domain-containing protein [Methylophilaceae bacterium]
MVDEAEVSTSTLESHFAPLGEVLLTARKAKKISQNDVSNKLRISIKQIEAIEKNAFELLPESAITRGFIRNYARLLGVDAEPLIASHRMRVPENEPASLHVKTTTRQVAAREVNRRWVKYILGSLFALLMLMAWIFYTNYAHKTPKVGSETAVVSDLPEVALPAAERQTTTEVAPIVSNSPTTPQTDVSTGIATNTQTNPLPVPLTSALPALPQQSTLADASAVVKNTEATKPEVNTLTPNNKVSMIFTEQTWVSARNSAGKVIFNRTFSAGEAGGFDAEPPITVIIGNAKATQLQYLGQPVDLSVSTKGNVARVKLP